VQSPPAIVIALALLAGFTLGAGAALIIELLDKRIRDEDELRRLYPLPVLAHVPAVPRRRRRALRSLATTPPAVKEAFRTLQVQLDRMGQLPRVLMLTSASSGDAKTTSAVNLAVTLLAAGHRVILIDFDLRKPDIAPTLNVEPRQRLTTLFSESTKLEDLLVSAPQAPTLRVLPADGKNDAVLLDALRRRLPQLFEEARELADYVVVDTPPLGELSDALRLVDLVDDVVVVARPGHTNRLSLETMRELLSRTGREPTGLLVIGGSASAASSYYSYGMGVGQQRGGERPVPRLAKS
jgi:capsular exopolysaccharide synthesis family protein